MALLRAYLQEGAESRSPYDRVMLLWAAACVVCMSGVSMMKVWYWMELNKNAVTREIKRLELQIARLAGRIKG